MKIWFVSFFFFLLASVLGAQVPEGFRYQAVARGSDGSLLKEKDVKVRIAILEGSINGTVVWEEEHAVTTNTLGIFSLTIGDATAVRTGGTVAAFKDIDWMAGEHFLRVSLDLEDGNGFSEMGTTPLLAVPYAFLARDVVNKDDADADSTNEIQDLHLEGNVLTITRNGSATQIDLSPYLDNPGWKKTGDTLSYAGSVGVGTAEVEGTKLAVQGDDVASEKPLFEVKRKDGQTVFAVYNDSIRMYVNAGSGKGPRGGFAIGGFGMTKGTQPLFWLSPDSARIYLDESSKGPRGGFAIGGYGVIKAPVSNFLNITPENYFIGHQSGEKNTWGKNNLFIGYQSGMENTTGYRNVFLGFQSGMNNTSGNRNIFIGDRAGSNNTTGYGNLFFGEHAGYSNKDGYRNMFIGFRAGYENVSGHDNMFIGDVSGYKNRTGSENLFIGQGAGYSNETGRMNVFLGNTAGSKHKDGSWNIFLGFSAGYSDTSGIANVLIGHSVADNLGGGYYNVMVGYYAGGALTLGGYNTTLGGMSLFKSDTAYNNVAVGYQAGYQAGSGNVMVGYMAGHENTGDYNLFLGYKAGYNETGSNKLVIAGGASGRPLITGDFQTKRVNIHDVLRLVPRSRPASPQEGEIYVDSTNHHIYCYLNGAWRQLD